MKMEEDHLCRCCLSKGACYDINTSYVFCNKKEVYSRMLTECYNIELHTFNSGKICSVCVKTLRTSFEFKQQVLRCEQEFMKRIQELSEKKPIIVKVENGNIQDDESDDYSLPDAVTNVKIEGNNLEADRREEKIKGGSVVKKKNWRKIPSESIKSFVKKLAVTIEKMPQQIKIEPCTSKGKNGTSQQIKIEPCTSKGKSRRATPSKVNTQPNRTSSAVSPDKKAGVLFINRMTNEKLKHLENLQTILDHSTATPFRNKTQLGYLCGYCDQTFREPNDLRRHTKQDHVCERMKYKRRSELFNVRLDVVDLACKVCGDYMDDLTVLKQHLVKEHGKTIHSGVKDFIMQFKLAEGEVYACALCPSTHETYKMLQQHMHKHYQNYACGKCEATFATERSLNTHATVHQAGQFKCGFCEKVFASKEKKAYHEKGQHLGLERVRNCPKCDQHFQNYYQRNQHMVNVHNDEAKYKCSVCDKSYLLKSLLMNHIRKSHLMERSCQCTECGNRFFNKKALRFHMLTHTGEKNYRCEVCNKAYARKYTLREHMRIHNNDRRFKCDVCGSAFVQKCSLKSHLLTHHAISVPASSITALHKSSEKSE